MIKYIIVDDEHIAHDIIKDYCDLLPTMELQKHCYDAIEALEYLNKYQVDLIFLDLNMPKLKGFEFLKTLVSPPKVIVITAYKEFALEGYELNIVDYLLKPFGFERFLKAVNKVIGTSQKTKIQNIPKNNTENTNSIFLRSNKKYIQVTLDAIQFIEAAGNYTKIVTTDTTVTIREKISDVLLLLPENDFLQVHKSFAVTKRHISSIEGNRILIEDHSIPIGKMYKMNIDKLLN
ncbi:LytR/AlgR family response regulator transcription factor [Tenacibaculum sp. Ill]|uniref:LytR/AlgR family response regulator transcription factor n=1 Tax=Tenacibaculum sp. Ill TaxID=3445935 RepID=UPI003F78E81A